MSLRLLGKMKPKYYYYLHIYFCCLGFGTSHKVNNILGQPGSFEKRYTPVTTLNEKIVQYSTDKAIRITQHRKTDWSATTNI